MNQNISRQPHNDPKPRIRQTRPRTDVETMLREIAFVLRMTERVRVEIETEQEVEEPVLV
jgi:hypothetical protein